MGHDSMLVPAVVLHGSAAVTFGLAFFGLWRAFGRPAPRLWAAGFGGYGLGSLLAAFVMAHDSVDSPQFGVALVAIPAIMLLIATPSFLRPAAEALVGEIETKTGRLLAVWAGAAVVLVGCVVVANVVGAATVSVVLRMAVPRFILSIGLVWAALPLFRPAARGRVALQWLAIAMLLLAVRYFASGILAFADVGVALPRIDGPILVVGQVGVVILLGVAATVALVGQERDIALESAATIRRTADALRESETKFRFLIENSSDMILLIDAARRIRFIAPNCERHLGIAPAAAQARDFLEFVHPDDRQRAGDGFQRFVESRGDARAPVGSMRIHHQSGHWLAVEVRARLVQENGAPPLVVLAARDVTVQQDLQAALLQAQRLDSLGQMAARVAHDFNNLLVVMLCAADQGAEDVTPEHPARSAFRDIREAGAQGAELTRKLLMFARRQPTQVEVFDLRDRLERLRPMVERLVGPSVELELEGKPGPVKADPTQFEQVVLNLAANARDAMPGGGRLTFRVSRTPAGGVRLVVTDTGIGIAPEAIERLFEPFYTTKSAERGTGLGLASAYGFARQAGGTLSAESTLGHGASFVLELPAAETARV